MEISPVTLAPPIHPRPMAGGPREVTKPTGRNRMRPPHATQHDRIHKQYSTTKHIHHPVEPQHADSHTQPHCPRRVHSTHTRHYRLTKHRNPTQPHTCTDNTHTAEHDQHTVQGLDRTRTPLHEKRRHQINTHTTHTHTLHTGNT